MISAVAGCTRTASLGCSRDLLGMVHGSLSSNTAKGAEKQCLWWSEFYWSISLWGGESRAASEAKEPWDVMCWF